MTGGPIELEPLGTPDPPPLPGCVLLADSLDDAADALLADLLARAIDAIDARRRFDLAVVGDRSLERLWLRCMLDPDLRSFPWKMTHVWIVDGSEGAWLQDALVRPAGIPPGHVRIGHLGAAAHPRMDCLVSGGAGIQEVITQLPGLGPAGHVMVLVDGPGVDRILGHIEHNPAPWTKATPHLRWYL